MKTLEERREYARAYYIANKQKILKRVHKYYINNSDKVKAYSKSWAKANKKRVLQNSYNWIKNNSERSKAIVKKSRQKRREAINLWKREYRKTHKNEYVLRNKSRREKLVDKTSDFTITNKIRKRVWRYLKRKIKGKGHHHKDKGLETTTLLGCSFEQFKFHIESLFQPGMSWANWTFNGWHLDHIRPISSFDSQNKEELKKVWHYTNLQPIWAKDNLEKGAKYDK